jgi:outer membrane protein assembly factor BamB
MRATRCIGIIGIMLSLALLLAPGCAGMRGGADLAPAVNAPDSIGTLLPPPGALHQVSATEISVNGASWQAPWPHNYVAAAGIEGLYSPAYSGATRDFAHLAYAVYSLNISSFTGTPALRISISTEGEAGSGWIGLGDYSKDRWDWYELPTPVSSESILDITLLNRDKAGVMPVALAFTGTQPWQVATIKLGESMVNGPGEWPMSGRDRTNTHRIANSGPQTNTLSWHFSCDGAGTPYTGIAVAADNTIYAGNGASLIAYDSDGHRLWDCPGISPVTKPAIASDGTIYVGGGDANPGLHAISPDGELLWTFTTPLQVKSDPAVGPDGKIFFACDDGKLYEVSPAGAENWSRTFPGQLRSHPAVGPDGSVYLGWQTNDFIPIGHIVAIAADHSEKWDYNTDKMPVMRPAIGSDGAVYCMTSTTVFAFNADGSSRWQKTYPISMYSMPFIGAENQLYFGGSDGNLYKLKTDGSTDWTYAADSSITGGPVLNADGDLVACTTNGTLFACNTSGAEQWSYSSGSTTRVTPGTGSSFASFVTEDGYLSTVLPSGALDWRIGAGGAVVGAPVVADDGTAYIGSADGVLYAVRPSGTVKWRYKTGYAISCSPAIGPGGVVYVGSGDWKLHAVSAAGAALWQFDTTSLIQCSPVLGDDGTIYFGSDNSYLYAVRADGTEKWKYKTKYQGVKGAPAVDGSGNVYIAAMDRYIHAITSYGEVNWTYKGDGSFWGGVALGADGTIYAGCEKDSESGVLYALNGGGTKKWSYNTSGPIHMCPALSPDGGVVVATVDGTVAKGGVYALTSGGSLKWQYPTVSCPGQGVAIDKDGVVYVGMAGGSVRALSDNTTSVSLKWQYDLPGITCYSPGLIDGRLLIGAGSGLVAIGN